MDGWTAGNGVWEGTIGTGLVGGPCTGGWERGKRGSTFVGTGVTDNALFGAID